MSDAPGLLLASLGLEIDGGIASVARCMALALDEAIAAGRVARADRVLLLDDPRRPPAPPRRGRQRFARGRQPLFAWQLWRSYRRHRPDLLLFDMHGPARALHLPLPGFPPPRYAIFCHGIELARAREEPHATAFRGAWRLLCNSERTGDTVRAFFPELGDRVRVVPLCIDPARTVAWEALGPIDLQASREPAALIIGRMWAEERGKGHDELLEGWQRVRDAVPDARLWIVGQGDDRPRLEARARELGQEGAVEFLGRVPDAVLSDLYRRASVLVMPSRQEGFGLVYAEAMWHGLPCIGSTSDAAAEVIRDGVTGRLVPYGDVAAIADAVVETLRDPALRRERGEAGAREARERFGYPRFRDDLLRALELV